jgi:hypothetical protein
MASTASQVTVLRKHRGLLLLSKTGCSLLLLLKITTNLQLVVVLQVPPSTVRAVPRTQLVFWKEVKHNMAICALCCSEPATVQDLCGVCEAFCNPEYHNLADLVEDFGIFYPEKEGYVYFQGKGYKFVGKK